MLPRNDALWGAKSIANEISCSVDKVYELASDPLAPVYKPGGRYYARRSELQQWLRSKPEKPRNSQI
jgi:hypothetical protein